MGIPRRNRAHPRVTAQTIGWKDCGPLGLWYRSEHKLFRSGGDLKRRLKHDRNRDIEARHATAVGRQR